MKKVSLEFIKACYPDISFEDGVAVYGMIALLRENSEKDVREVLTRKGLVKLDNDIEFIIAMAKNAEYQNDTKSKK